MDPNVNLQEQLALSQKITRVPIPHADDSLRLAELVLALHAWIRDGGFLPQVWK